LIADSRDAGILIIQLRCNSLRRVPERWLARPVHTPARRVGAPVRMAAAAERVDVAGDSAEESGGVSGSFLA
jgi:hypothetical protein